MVGVDLNFGALLGIEDGLWKLGLGDGERLAETGSACGRDATVAVHVSWVEGGGRAGEGGALLKRRDEGGEEEGRKGLVGSATPQQPPDAGPYDGGGRHGGRGGRGGRGWQLQSSMKMPVKYIKIYFTVA